MEDKKEFDPNEFLKYCKNCKNNKDNFDGSFWIVLIFLLCFGFQPNNNMGCTESYLKGKVDAYENFLNKIYTMEGVDCSDR